MIKKQSFVNPQGKFYRDTSAFPIKKKREKKLEYRGIFENTGNIHLMSDMLENHDQNDTVLKIN